MTSKQLHILFADDELLNQEIVTEYLADSDYQISTVENGQIAWQKLAANPNKYDIILLDRMMPEMDGLELLLKIKDHPILKFCPVIFQTAKATKTDIIEGLQAGAYYYLTKPFEQKMLLSIINTAARDRQQHLQLQESISQLHCSLGLMKSANFTFQTLDQANNLAILLSNACPKPEKIINGITELMINAIEHGNLNINYELKSALIQSGEWYSEVNRRQKLPANQDKYAEINFNRSGDECLIIVTDQGEGFDWQRYMDFDPDRVMDNHGRGIAMANKLSFTRIEYRGCGNQVCAYF